MSLTNPNTVVTEKRLNEFYKGILPYMGGMPEMLANKFSKGDLYSTDEKMIGQWTDGKPLYQKSFVSTMPSTTTDFQIAHKDIPVQSLNIDTVVLISGIFDDGNLYINIGIGSGVISANLTTGVSSVWYNKGDARINLEHNRAPWSNRNCVITIQYTKTTDSAISIGSDTDYSTEEKIIGTWIDGKPLYQKTVNVGSVSAGTTKTVDFNGIDMVCAFSGVAHSQAYNQQIPIVFGHQNMTNYVVNVLYTENNNKINVYTGDDFSLDWCFITIQYTKTTD
jgi:hypothetical protein